MNPTDLHIHTTASDGTDSPAELIEKVRAAGIRRFSVTDHDTCEATAWLNRQLAEERDLRFTCGIEFSCQDAGGKYHILGYGFDPAGAAIRDGVQKAHDNRQAKVHFRLEWLQQNLGVAFSKEDVDWLLSNPNPGKPHFGNLLVKMGLAADRNTAIREYVNRCPDENWYLLPEEAIAAILGAGGVPVLAHGFFGDGAQLLSQQELAERVERLRKHGLQGLEGYYPRYSAQQQDFLLELAERNGLYISAGSDYHGSNKTVRLGDAALPAEPAAGFLRLLERLELE